MTEAFTLYTSDIEEMATEASRRFTEHTGIPSVLKQTTKEKVHVDKLRVLLDYKGPVWFFDADLWFLQKVDLPELYESKFLVSTPSIAESVRMRCKEDGIDYSKAFCTCLFGLNMGVGDNRSMISRAMDMQFHACPNGKPGVDERFLNRAAQSMGFDFALLRNINHTSLGMGDDTCAAHAARKKNKLEWLRIAAEVWRTKSW